ncbi:MAG: GAF domain-containing protein [Anaerolineae bacterium]
MVKRPKKTMTADLQQEIEHLRQQLAQQEAENVQLHEETHRQAAWLQLIEEVNRRLSSVLDLDESLIQVVELIREAFNYYHVSVSLVDRAGGEVIFRAGTGEAGEAMRQEQLCLRIGSEGVIGWVAGAGQPLLVSDVSHEPRFLPHPMLPETRSELAVPLQVGRKTLGVLDVHSNRLEALKAADVPNLQAVAGQIAVAIENARLFKEWQDHVSELAALNRIAQATGSTMRLEGLLEALYEAIQDLIGAATFFIALYDKDSEMISFPFYMDDGVRYRAREPMPLGEGLASVVIASKKPLLIRDFEKDKKRFPGKKPTIGSGRPARSWLGVPFILQEEAVGLMAIQDYEAEAFDERHVQLLSSIASHVMVAIEKARLFDRTVETVNELKAAHEAQQRLLATVRELSTPIIPVLDRVLVMPLVGAIDTARSQQIIETLLSAITTHDAEVVIIDITGVSTMDTRVANYLLEATRAASLLGAQCVLVGIAPEVAQTVIHLGVDLSGLVTMSDLQSGLQFALARLNRRIIEG